MEPIIVVGDGILGLLVAAMLVHNGYKVTHVRMKFPKLASITNQGTLWSGVSGFWNHQDANIVETFLASHEEFCRMMGSSETSTGLMTLSGSRAGQLEDFFEESPFGWFEETSLDESGLSGLFRPELDDSTRILRIKDRSWTNFVDSSWASLGDVLNALHRYLTVVKKEKVTTRFLDEPWLRSDVEKHAGDKKVILCCGTRLPELLGKTLTQDLLLTKTPLIITKDVEGLDQEFYLNFDQNFAVVRHRSELKSVLVWASHFGLELDPITRECEDRGRISLYDGKWGRFRALVSRFVGKAGILAEEECIRIESSAPMAPWIRHVGRNIWAAIPGKASGAIAAGIELMGKAGIDLSKDDFGEMMAVVFAEYLSGRRHGGFRPYYQMWWESYLR